MHTVTDSASYAAETSRHRAEQPTFVALGDIAEAIIGLTSAIGVVTTPAVPYLDRCEWCDPDAVETGDGECLIAHEAPGSRFAYRDTCCAACLPAAVREYTRDGRNRVWVEIPTAIPAVVTA